MVNLEGCIGRFEINLHSTFVLPVNSVTLGRISGILLQTVNMQICLSAVRMAELSLVCKYLALFVKVNLKRCDSTQAKCSQCCHSAVFCYLSVYLWVM